MSEVPFQLPLRIEIRDKDLLPGIDIPQVCLVASDDQIVADRLGFDLETTRKQFQYMVDVLNAHKPEE